MSAKSSRVNGSRERFGRFAPRYVTSETHAKAPELQRLVEIACPEQAWSMLDIATGGGHTALAFAPYVGSVLAADISAGMLSAAREFILLQGAGNVSFSYAEAERLPFLASGFDLVTCRIAAHHFSDVKYFLLESARVLKPGGSLLVQDQCLPENADSARYIDRFERLRDPSHNRSFSASEWVENFQLAGFEVVHREIIKKKHHFESWAGRQDCSQAVKEEFVEMVRAAPEQALLWMQPSDFGGPQATFYNHHILIASYKGLDEDREAS